jgi:hypothetical protein
MNNSKSLKTLRRKPLRKLNNTFQKACKITNIKTKYNKYELNRTSLNIIEKENELILYCTDLEKKFNIYDEILHSNYIKNVNLTDLVKYLQKNSIKTNKKYDKTNYSLFYKYDLPVTNKIIYNEKKNKIYFEDINFESNNQNKESKIISYVLKIYLFPNNNYRPDGKKFIFENLNNNIYEPYLFWYKYGKNNYKYIDSPKSNYPISDKYSIIKSKKYSKNKNHNTMYNNYMIKMIYSKFNYDFD